MSYSQVREAANLHGGASTGLRRRRDLLDLFEQLTPKIHDLTRALEEEVPRKFRFASA